MSAGESVRGWGDPLVCAHIPRNGDDPDGPLVEAAKQGDRQALSELSARYAASVYHKVFRLVRNREDAEDLVQETLLKAFTHLGQFRGAAKFFDLALSNRYQFCSGATAQETEKSGKFV
jgi:hypothetical protein